MNWWGGSIEDSRIAIGSYRAYIDTIRSKLPPDLATLLDRVSLHDSKVARFSVNLAERQVLLILRGYVDPWRPEGITPRTITLKYDSVRSVESTHDTEEYKTTSEHLDGSDLGYHELELLDDGVYEHRMLFASGIELVLRFGGLQLSYEDEPVQRPQ